MRLRCTAPLVWLVLLAAPFLPVTSPARADGRVTCFTAFDNDYFYIAATVRKPTLKGTQSAPFADPLGDDAVAVFLDASPDGPRRSAHSVEMVVSASGAGQLYRGAQATPLRGPQDFLKLPGGGIAPFKYAVTLQGTLNDATPGGAGYTVEIAIPWLELGGTPEVGQRMAFNVVALSAAPDSARVLSMSPAVKTDSDLQNASLWGEIVFVASVVKTVASAPRARVCARVFTAKPLMDGQLTEGEWSRVTAFAFSETGGGGSTGAAVAAVAARRRPKVELKAPRPALPLPVPAARAPAPRRPQAVPRLTFALYRCDVQADPRKELPATPVRSADGATVLAAAPLDGAGPWMSCDSTDWHLTQLERARRAGIDAILPIYAPRGAIATNANRALSVLSEALRVLQAGGRDHPLVGMFLEDAAASAAEGGSLSAGDRLYAAVKSFFLRVPEPVRLAIPLTPENGGGAANLVVLRSAAALGDEPAAAIAHCRARYLAEFGHDLLFVGPGADARRAALDGALDSPREAGMRVSEGGWIPIASVAACVAPLGRVPGVPEGAPRGPGAYREAWRAVAAAAPAWVVVDSWNDFAAGYAVSPTERYGLEIADATRAYARALCEAGGVRGVILSDTLPAAAPAGSTWQASLRLMNGGQSVWPAGGVSLAYQWADAHGALQGQPVEVPLAAPLAPRQAVTVPLVVGMPTTAGRYALVVAVAASGRSAEIAEALASPTKGRRFAVAVHGADGGRAGAWGVRVLGLDLPSTVEAGGTYTAHVSVRNEGDRPWTPGDTRLVARLSRYVSPLNGTGETGGEEPVPIADASGTVSATLAPGQTAIVPVTVTFSAPDGAPLTAWSSVDNWTYLLRWECSAAADGSAGALSGPAAICVVDMDAGPVFTADFTTSELPGDRRVPVRIGLRNAGPQTWLKSGVRVGYHWYFQDGIEAIWEDETTALPSDVEPGGEVREMYAWVTPPPFDGVYWLVWDLKVGDTWVSTLPGVRPYESRVHRVEVVHGRLRFVDLSSALNLAGVATAAAPTSGGFDEAGHALPAELVPPFASTSVAASTLWLPIKGTGPDASRHLAFRWPAAGGGKSVVQCAGQRVVVAAPRRADLTSAVHLLAAATKPNATAGFTLQFADGSEQYASFPFSQWDAPPAFGEEIAYACAYSHGPEGAATGPPVRLYRYTIRIPEPRKLTAIVLPNAPSVKILAITAER